MSMELAWLIIGLVGVGWWLWREGGGGWRYDVAYVGDNWRCKQNFLCCMMMTWPGAAVHHDVLLSSFPSS